MLKRVFTEQLIHSVYGVDKSHFFLLNKRSRNKGERDEILRDGSPARLPNRNSRLCLALFPSGRRGSVSRPWARQKPAHGRGGSVRRHKERGHWRICPHQRGRHIRPLCRSTEQGRKAISSCAMLKKRRMGLWRRLQRVRRRVPTSPFPHNGWGESLGEGLP